jgi:HlyD family secretion protein
VQPGDQVPAGKLLMVLDDVEARARLATAESGVKAAQAAVEAATHNGTLQERQAAAATTWPAPGSSAIRRGAIWTR